MSRRRETTRRPEAARKRRAPGRRSRRDPARRPTGAATAAAMALAAVALGVTTLVGGPGVAGAATADTGSSQASLRLGQQTPWVRSGGAFELHLAVSASRPLSQLELDVAVFDKVHSRSGFQQTLRGREQGGVLSYLNPIPLAGAATDAAGRVVVRIPVGSGPDAILDPSSCGGSCDGVYPVRVRLEDHGSGSVLAQITTYLVETNQAPGAPRLGFVLILPVHAPPSLQPDGQRRLSARASSALAALVTSLSSNPSVPVALLPTPETLQGLATTGRQRDQATLAGLRRLAAEQTVHQVVTGPYVPIDAGALGSSGLSNEIADQVDRGSLALESTIGAARDPTTWVTDSSMSPEGLTALNALAVKKLVLPAGDLQAVESNLTPTGISRLTGPGSYQPEEAASDPGLAAHFGGPDPVLAANQLLADLAVLYFDEPARSPRAIVAEAPSSWTPNSTFLDTVLSGLATSPVVAPETLDTMFASFAGAPLSTRHLASGSSGSPGLPAGQIRRARQQLSAFASVAGPENPVLATIDDLLLVAESAGMRPAETNRYVEASRDAIAGQVSRIALPPDRSVTLTSSTARIPITVVSGTGYPVHAVLSLVSDKLTFPNGSSRPLVLDRPNFTEYFKVRTRAAGDFPLRVTLRSPTGGLLLVQARITVRSTGASGVAIGLTAGAVAVLLAWWLRSLLRGRRRRAG